MADALLPFYLKYFHVSDIKLVLPLPSRQHMSTGYTKATLFAVAKTNIYVYMYLYMNPCVVDVSCRPTNPFYYDDDDDDDFDCRTR